MNNLYNYKNKEAMKFSNDLREYWGKIINDCNNLEESGNTAQNICYDAFIKAFLVGYNYRKGCDEKAIKEANAYANKVHVENNKLIDAINQLEEYRDFKKNMVEEITNE